MSHNVRSGKKTSRRVKLHGLGHADRASPANSALFWYSYESALNWVRNNESIISKCVQLLQIYPNLIQDSSFDTFWEFIESLIRGESSNKNEDKRSLLSAKLKKDTHSFSRNQEKESIAKGPGIPHISVTESAVSSGPAFTIPAQQARTPRVHLISRNNVGSSATDDKLLHLGVIDMLQEDFYIRATNWTHQSNVDLSKELHRQYVVAESDVCVYLFNETTLVDSACFHDLCTALAQKIPVVYVRHHKTQLPKTFSETINVNSNGCITLKDYIEKFMPSLRSSSTSTPSVKNSRVKKKLAPLIVGNRSKSATDLYMKGKDGIQEKNDRLSENLEIDLVLTLVSNFKNACVFDERDFLICSSRLRQTIYHVLGISESNSESPNNGNNIGENSTAINNAINNFKSTDSAADFSRSCKNRHAFLSVPDPEDMMSTREWGHFGSASVVPDDQRNHECDISISGDDSIFFDSDARAVVSPGSEHRATTYLIFDQNKAPIGPRKVAFPTDGDSASEIESDDYSGAPDSPINFHEIDLSREINSRGTPESETSSVS